MRFWDNYLLASQRVLLSPNPVPLSPAIALDFPDPALLIFNSSFHAFATNSNGRFVQYAVSTDFDSWNIPPTVDILPQLPQWVNPVTPNVWAPSVIQNDAGNFVLYFAAALRGDPSIHCVGVATSKTVTGPYKARSEPFACPLGAGGAIDASGFQDKDGRRYVLYKVDGNALGQGGSCNNGIPPFRRTPIMLQPVDGDGVTARGEAVQLIDREGEDGPLVEAPSLALIGGQYVLFYSSGCFDSPSYDVRVAVADRVAGPYTKRQELMSTGDFGLDAPGGADVSDNGEWMLFHAGRVGERWMYTARIQTNGSMVSACAGGICKTFLGG